MDTFALNQYFNPRKRGVVVSGGLPVAACNKYYGIGLVVIKHVYVKTEKARLYCLQCGLNANERVLKLATRMKNNRQ